MKAKFLLALASLLSLSLLTGCSTVGCGYDSCDTECVTCAQVTYVQPCTSCVTPCVGCGYGEYYVDP